MKVDYEDYLDDDYFEEVFLPIKSRKFRDIERANAGGDDKHRRNIRKKRQARQKQRKQEEYKHNEYDSIEEEY